MPKNYFIQQTLFQNINLSFLRPIYVSEKLTIVFTPYSFLIISILSRNASSTDYTIKQISIKIGNKDLYIMISFDDIFI